MSTPISAQGTNGSPVPVKATDDGLLKVSPSNILNKFRETFETYEPVIGNAEAPAGAKWREFKGTGDLVHVDGNAVSASYLVISKSPLHQGTVTEIETISRFMMPLEMSVGLSMSQRTLGQELAVEVVDDDKVPVVTNLGISSISQTGSTVLINTAVPHGLVAGKRIGTVGVPDSRLNYPALVVGAVPNPNQIIVTAGPGGNLPSVTASSAGGSIFFRSAVGYAQNGTSMIFENSTATNASIYVRGESGDTLPSGTAAGNHSLTVGTTAPVQAINSTGMRAFFPTTEFRLTQMADRLQWTDAPVDTTAGATNRQARTQVIPNPKKAYKFRLRFANNDSFTVPIAQIVSVTKTGSTTARMILDRPVDLTNTDQIVAYGPRAVASAAEFQALAAATSITVVNPTTIDVVWGTTNTITSYGGWIARVNGGNLMSALGANLGGGAVQSAAVSTLSDGTRILTLVGASNWSGLQIGDGLNTWGIRNIVDGSSLGVDGVFRVRDIATTSLVLEPIGDTVLPADFTAVNCGGYPIKRTEARVSFVRVFDFERERVEIMPGALNDLARAITVAIAGSIAATQSGTWNVGLNAGTQAIGTVGIANGQGAEDAAAAGNAVRTAGRVRTSHPTTFVAGDAADVTMTTGLAQVVRPYSVPEADVTYSGLLTTTSDVAIQVAAGAGLKRHVTSLWMINTGAALVDFILKDGTTERERYPLPVNVPVPVLFPTGATLTANAALNGALSAAGTVRVIVKGYTAP